MQENRQAAAAIRFGVFEMNLQSEELLRDGVVVKLPRQPFTVLLLLVERAGQLVSREEIQRQVWDDRTFVDYEKGLNFCIRQIREALGDNAQSPQYVETLPRRGYRFIAPVALIADSKAIAGTPTEEGSVAVKPASDESSGEDAPPEPLAAAALPSPGALQSSRRAAVFTSRRRLAVASVLALLLLSAALLWFRATPASSPASSSATSSASSHPSGQSVSPSAGKTMLVVLPFENLNADPMQDYFSDGLTEEMISQLGRLRPEQLGVIARTTALTYKKTSKDIRQIGQELGVGFVLEGSVRREGERVRITAQLIQVSDQTHLWAETYERSERDLLAIQSEVANRIARALTLELLPATTQAPTIAKTSNPQAYDAYLKGRFLVTKDTLPDLERSLAYFDRATVLDPQFALAFAAAVEARVLLATWKNLPAHKVYDKVKSDAQRAMELDSALAESYAAQGAVNFWLERDWAQAQANIERALALNPSNPNTHILCADFLMSRGQAEAAAEHLREALALDPVSLLTSGLAAYGYLRLRRYDEAIEQANRMLELEPTSYAGHDILLTAYHYQGKHEPMRELLRRWMAENGAKREALAALDEGTAQAALARQQRRQYEETVAVFGKDEWATPLWLAQLAARVGENEQALVWLERAIGERLPGVVFLAMHPDFDAVRQEPRYEEFVRRLKLPL